MKTWQFHLLVVFLLILTGCDGESAFYLIHFAQEGSEGVFLNEPLVFLFNREIDQASINTQTVTIRKSDGLPAEGVWMVRGKALYYHPRLPRRADCSDSGLNPGTVYTVHLRGFPHYNAVQSTDGSRLDRSCSFSFRTMDIQSTLISMFVDPNPDSGPRLLAVGDSELDRIGMQEGETVQAGDLLRLTFSEPIFPESVARNEAKINIINMGDSVDPELDFLKLKSRLIEDNNDKGVIVGIEPEGGFQAGRCYKLWYKNLDYLDFGGNRIENTFHFVSIDCR